MRLAPRTTSIASLAPAGRVDEVGSPYSTKLKKTTITKNKTKKKTKEISPKAKEDDDKSRTGWLLPGCWLHPGLRFRSNQSRLGYIIVPSVSPASYVPLPRSGTPELGVNPPGPPPLPGSEPAYLAGP